MNEHYKYKGFFSRYYIGKWAPRIQYVLFAVNLMISLICGICYNYNKGFTEDIVLDIWNIALSIVIIHLCLVAFEFIFVVPLFISQFIDIIENSKDRAIIDFIIGIVYFCGSFILAVLLFLC